MVNSEWVRSRYVVLLNRLNQKAVVLDTFKKRLWLMRHRIYDWAGVMDLLKKECETRMVMIMLTYEKVEDYSPGHIRDYMKKLKQSVGENLYGFAWVCEIQERGAVHYHLVMVVKKGSRIPIPDKSGMWKYGWSGIHTARTPFYLLKYTGKERQKDLSRYPKSCRLYSVSYRLPEGRVKAFYKARQEMYKLSMDNIEGAGDIEDLGGSWEYLGASVTKGYAEKVLVPSGYEVK
jgi:hypothetical protein